MPSEPQDPKDVGFYFAVSQVGMEMVVPVGAGALLDHYLNWAPWGTIVGALLGLAVGMTHLVLLLANRQRRPPSERQGPS